MKRTFKKAVSVFLVVAMLLCAAPLGGFVGLDLPGLFDFRAEAESYSGTCGTNLTWSLDTDTGVLDITGTGTMTNWITSSKVPWGSYRKRIKTVNISSGLTSIGDHAFEVCTNLASVTIPDSVTSIGKSAFDGCTSLTNVTIGDSVTSIGDYAFRECTSLTSVTIGNSVKSIGSSAFRECTSLTSVTIGNSVKSIGSYVFDGCTSLTNITVDKSNTAFSSDEYGVLFNKDKTQLIHYPIGNERTSYTIPDSVTSIGSSAFEGCTSLASVIIGNSVTSIGGYAFAYCETLTSVTIPNSVTSIGSYAFRDCTSLASVTIGNSVTSIGNYTFSGCSALKDVYYNGDISSWLNISFSSVYSTPLYYGAKLYFDGELATDIVIPDGIESINNFAFYGCTSLTSVTIPDSVTSIGNSVFKGCTSLASVTIPDSVTSIGDSVFSGCTSLASVIIGNSVTSIGESAFYGCKSLASITIPDSVTSIGESAFSGCTSLVNATIPDSVTSIGRSSFSGCSALKDVYYTGDISSWLNISFNSYNSNPLYYGAKLYFDGELATDIVIPDGIESINNFAFYGCTSLTSVTIPDSVTIIGNSAFDGCTSLASVIIGNSVTSIGESAFYGCKSLTSVTIPDSVTSIGSSAFKGCTSLASVIIGNSVTSIGNDAFYGCKSLVNATIPDSVTSIDSSSFSGCSNLVLELKKGSYAETYANKNNIRHYYIYDGSEDKTVSVTVTSNLSFEINKETYTMTINCSGNMLSFAAGDAPWLPYKEYIRHIVINDGCTSISANAFENMHGLKSITIPDSVTSIGDYAFSDCKILTSITIPDSVTSIGDYAFSGCTSLASIIISDSVTSISDYVFRNCTSLTSVTIPDSVTSIGDYAFDGCTSLTSVTIGNSVKSIGSYVFMGCTSLTSVIIPDSVTSIGDYTFYNCTGITELTIPVSTKIYNNSHIFYNCTNIEKITLTKGNGTFQNYGTSTSSSSITCYQYTPWYISREKCTEVIIEDGVTGIGDYMFYNCAELGNISLPISVKSIGNNAFVSCQKLEKLKVYNRNCEFGETATGYYTTIVGYAGSTAEAYANANGFDFELIPEDDHEHIYSNSCDNECNICGYIDPDRSHVFANDCDPECDVCGYTRTELVHTYTNDCDPDCDLCGYIRTDLVHTYTNDCDPDCDLCGYIRSDLEHKDENADGKCDVCETYISDIQVGVTQNVKVTAGKTVLLKFIPTQSGVYTFSSSSSSDTYGYIYDADQKQLASDDDSGGNGGNFSITYTLKKGTVYYLGVRFYNSSSSGEIPVKLSLDQIICDHINTHPEHLDSTCAQTGYDKVICDDCGDTVSITVIATLPHTYKTIVAEPTCVDEGVVVCLCSACRYAYIDEILDPLGHSEPVWKTVVKPTTSSEGTMNYVCPACDEVFDTKSIPAITLSGNSTAVVNFTTNTITGFNAGSTELEDYLSATNNGYVFTCSSDILCTGAVVELTDGETLINSYTVVVFGDVDGNGWYDANDAFIVNMIVSGLLPQENLPDYMRTAADCNHDGEINELDFDLLINASVLLDDVDQSATQPELTTQSAYIKYMSIIDQSVSLEVDDTAPETDEAVEPNGPVAENDIDFEVFITKLFEFFKKMFTFVFSFIMK